MVMNFLRPVMQLTKTTLLLSALVLFWVIPAKANSIANFDAEYKAYRFGRELGEARFQLEGLGREKYRLTYDSKVSLFFLSDERNEVSLFSYQNEIITPYKYQYRRTGTGSNKSLSAEFSRNKQAIVINGEQSLPWHGELDNQLYRLDLQLKLASGEQNFEYDLVNYRGEVRHYKLKVMGKEQLDLPYGMLEGIKVKIMRENKKRETFVWFSPELNYQLVRLQQFKDGEEQGDIQLSKFNSSNG